MCGSTISVSACVMSSQKQSVNSWFAVAVTSGECSFFRICREKLETERLCQKGQSNDYAFCKKTS